MDHETVNHSLNCACEVESLPPGYAFEPSDEELVVHYLIELIQNQPTIPFPDFVLEKIMILVHLYQHDPETLAGIYNYDPIDQQHMFFFTKSHKVNMCNRDRHWLPSSIDKLVLSNSGVVVGHKKKFIYDSGVPQNSTDNWVMYEFRAGAPVVNTNSSDDMHEEWIVCKIYKKEEEIENDLIDMDETEQMEQANLNFGTGQESDGEVSDPHQELNTSFAAL